MKLLNAAPGFVQRLYADLKGDVLNAQGKTERRGRLTSWL
jgi:hypothetical protein